MHCKHTLIRWLDQIRDEDTLLVGGKATNLARLIALGVNCPPGFCVTTRAFESLPGRTEFESIISEILQDGSKSGQECASDIGRLLRNIEVPAEVQAAISEAYGELQLRYGENLPLAIRSSALVEDAKTRSFAGQFDSFLGIQNDKDLIHSLKNCWLSLFSARSIAYARRRHIEIRPFSMGVVVQKLVQARSAGVMFTIHPATSQTDCIFIEGILGLGERLVAGQVSPDSFVISKDSLAIIQRNIAKKEVATLFDAENRQLLQVDVDANLQNEPALRDNELIELARLGCLIESAFGCPQDIEWALEDGQVSILQTRPVTVLR